MRRTIISRIQPGLFQNIAKLQPKPTALLSKPLHYRQTSQFSAKCPPMTSFKPCLLSKPPNFRYSLRTTSIATTSFLASTIILSNQQLTPKQQECSVSLDEIETVLEFEQKIAQQQTPEQLFPNLPIYTLHDVKEMSRVTDEQNQTKRIIIIQGDYIYDLTDFCEVHPGGDKILQALYGFADPFWLLYTVHKESAIVYQVLNEYRVGILAQPDREAHRKQMIELEKHQSSGKNNQWKYEPTRHPFLHFLSTTPCNAEAPLYLCADKFITPSDLFFIRNHHPAPVSPTPPSKTQIDESPSNFVVNPNGILTDEATSTLFLPHDEVDKYPITITLNKHLYDHGDQQGKATLQLPYNDGSDKTITIHLTENQDTQQYETVMTIGDLKRVLPSSNVISTIICSGNRRSEMNRESKGKTDGLAWGFGAVSTGDFAGIKLASLFSLFGINYLNYQRLSPPTAPTTAQDQSRPEPHCVVFALDSPFDTSFPLHHVLNPEKDVILAFEMNGEALSPDQGYPVKFLVPGASGNRQVKWLSKISLDFQEATSAWHVSTPYRYTGPGTNSSRTPSQSPPVYFWPVFSNILSPISYQDGSDVDQPHTLTPATVDLKKCGEQSLLSLKTQLLRNFPQTYPNPNSIQIDELSTQYQCMDVSGLAYVGNGIGINRVDTTVVAKSTTSTDTCVDIPDDHLIWTEGVLQRDNGDPSNSKPISNSVTATKHNHWAWVLWSSEVVVPKDVKPGDQIEITSKAVDNMFNSQPRSMMNIWNSRGILNNGWCKHPVFIGKTLNDDHSDQKH